MFREENKSRVTVIAKTPNPLFEKWLLEFINEAVLTRDYFEQKKCQNALKSLRKFPILLKSGKECIILEHFDRELCLKLDNKLAEHNEQNCSNSCQISEEALTVAVGETRCRKIEDIEKKKNCNKNNTEKKKKEKDYKPSYRSAAYALLLTLYNNEIQENSTGFMTKSELQNKAQILCETSFKKSRPGTYYSGWSSMSQLLSKGLVSKISNPAKFSLTEAGRKLGKVLKEEQTDITGNPSIRVEPPSLPANFSNQSPQDILIDKQKASEANSSGGKHEPSNNDALESDVLLDAGNIALLPNTFEIILLVDTAETVGKDLQDDPTIEGLTALQVKFEVRHLKVGDYTWIARDINGKELILPYIVERKRQDDLAKSIKDGRFHEQKFRLKQCGLQNLIYLVEGCERELIGLPLSSLQQAVTNTMVTDDFVVKMTRNHSESMKYLANLSAVFSNTFKNKTLISGTRDDSKEFRLNDDVIMLMPFKIFMHGIGKSKNFTIKEMLVKQLVQLYGLSAEKAWVIASKYETPSALIEAFLTDGPNLLSNLDYGLLKRKIGPIISSTLHNFYTASSFD